LQSPIRDQRLHRVADENEGGQAFFTAVSTGAGKWL
jgi:hypothetical protein